LGNFIFDLINHDIYSQTKEGAILSLEIDKNTIKHNFIPIKYNVKLRTLEKGESNFINKINIRSDFGNYKKKWRSECYKLVFKRPTHKVLNPDNTSLQKRSIIRNFMSLKFYTRIFNIILNNKQRNLYGNAIYYKLIDL
jgi:hypothetical protein